MNKKQIKYFIVALAAIVAVIVWILLPDKGGVAEDPNLTYGNFNKIEVVSSPAQGDSERPRLEELAKDSLSFSYSQIAEEFRVADYHLYRCPVEGDDNLILTLTARSRLVDDVYTITAAKEAVVRWEPNMYEDLGGILYSDLDRAESIILPDFRSVSDSDMRFSTTTVSGIERELVYDWYYNILVVGTSVDCVLQGKRRLQGA